MCWSEDNEGKYVEFRLRVSDYFKAHIFFRAINTLSNELLPS